MRSDAHPLDRDARPRPGDAARHPARQAGRRPLAAAALCGTLALASGSCGDRSPVIPEVCEDRPGRLIIYVDVSGEAPVIKWAPNCAVDDLQVHQWPDANGVGGGTVWMIDSHGFGPPVVYGRKPRGVITGGGPLPLERGRRYTVALGLGNGMSYRWVGGGTFDW